MANLVSDVLDDGTIRVCDLDLSQVTATKTITKLSKMENKVINFDFLSTIFCLFAQSVDILTDAGWSTEDLIEEVITYSNADDVEDYLNPEAQDDDEDDDD